MAVLLTLPVICNAQFIKQESINIKLDSLVTENLFSGSILAVKGDEIIFSYMGGYSDREAKKSFSLDTQFQIASLTKQFTAAVVLKLFDEKRLSLNMPFGEILEWYPNSYKDSVTIHQLLCHESGILNYTTIPDWPSLCVKKFVKKEFVKLFAFEKLEFLPGSEFSYSNSNYYLLGMIAEELTGESYGNLLQRYIFIPLGMEGSCTLEDSETSIINVAEGYERLPNGYIEEAPRQDYSTAFSVSGIYSTPRDLIKWSTSLFSNKVLNEDMTRKMFMPNKNDYGYGLLNSQTNIPDMPNLLRNPFNKRFDSTARNNLTIVWHWGENPGFNSLLLKVAGTDYIIIILENIVQLKNNTPTLIPEIATEILKRIVLIKNLLPAGYIKRRNKSVP